MTLKIRFGIKKAKICKLRAKLGHLRSIKAEELTWWTIFCLCHGKCGQRQIESILDIRKIYFWALESQFGVQKANF